MENDNKKMVIEPILRSGLNYKVPSPQNYHSRLFIKHKVDMLGGVLSPLSPPPIIFSDGIGWKQVEEDYGHPELQFNRNFDTYSCVIFAIAKALCLWFFKTYGQSITISEMYNAFYAGVRQGIGTTIEAGMESFRKWGWGEDLDYPFLPTTTEAQYFSQPSVQIQIKFKGKLTVWNFHWEVIPNTLPAIFEYYKRVPVVLTGFAWASYYGTGVYYDYNQAPNHTFVGLEPKDGANLANSSNLISDTYQKNNEYVDNSQINVDALLKELSHNYNYGSAHICWLTPVIRDNLISKFINMTTQLVRDIRGGFHLIKNGCRQKLTSWWGLLAFIGELLQVKTISDDELNKNKDVANTPEHFFPENN